MIQKESGKKVYLKEYDDEDEDDDEEEEVSVDDCIERIVTTIMDDKDIANLSDKDFRLFLKGLIKAFTKD